MNEQFPMLRQPNDYDLKRSNMAQFMQWLESRGYGPFRDYQALHAWSVQNLETFWASIWEYTDVIASTPYDAVLASREMPGAEWFPGARLNFAENLLREALHGDPDKVAITAISETRPRTQTTYGELLAEVGALQQFLLDQGVKQGDRVAGVVANAPETVIAMLATTSIGAVWSSASPDFGVEGIHDRFGQIEPKILIAVNGYGYNGKIHSKVEDIQALQQRMPSVERVVMISNAPEVDIPEDPAIVTWDAAMGEGRGHAPAFEQLPFNQPVYILYSSGTTGVPKCIVHGAGGMLLQHSKELMLHSDISRHDTFFYFTTTGWMMWNWLASGLLTGAEIILFDGSPAYPSLDVLWEMAETEGITHFGTSAKFLGGCRNKGLRPGTDHNLGALRVIFSTGSPLLPEDYDWVYEAIDQDVLLASISGGTDICSCFVLACPLLPVRRGEIQCKGLGMDVKAYNDNGEPVVNERGELVCTQPVPCMPVMFWNDPNNERYKGAYFETFPGVWAHGDYIMFTERGGSVIYGRSDATLNPGGIRIGTAEIYRQVETLDEIADSIVVGQPVDGDVRVVLLVVLNEGHTLDTVLEQKIKQRIREGATPRHVPAKIVQVDDIPYTRSGKKVEVAVAKILRGDKVPNREALTNPETLDKIAALPDLQD